MEKHSKRPSLFPLSVRALSEPRVYRNRPMVWTAPIDMSHLRVRPTRAAGYQLEVYWGPTHVRDTEPSDAPVNNPRLHNQALLSHIPIKILMTSSGLDRRSTNETSFLSASVSLISRVCHKCKALLLRVRNNFYRMECKLMSNINLLTELNAPCRISMSAVKAFGATCRQYTISNGESGSWGYLQCCPSHVTDPLSLHRFTNVSTCRFLKWYFLDFEEAIGCRLQIMDRFEFYAIIKILLVVLRRANALYTSLQRSKGTHLRRTRN